MGIKVRMIFEVMGWPEENLHKALKQLLDGLREKWKVSREEYAEPKKLGEKMYSAFVEFEAEAPNLVELFAFQMAYAPSVTEVLSPSEIEVSAGQLQDIFADMASRLREMDKEIKVLAGQTKQMGQILQKLHDEGKISITPKTAGSNRHMAGLERPEVKAEEQHKTGKKDKKA